MKTGSPTVSVIMAAYNAASQIGPAIISILNQTFTDFELIVVDDGSVDNTADVVKSFADPRIILLRNPRNYKLPKSLNIAIDAARGRYTARQDADDLSLPSRLERQVVFLEKHPEVDVIGSSYYTFNDRGDIIGFMRLPESHEEIVSDPLNIRLMHPTIMGRTEWFRRFRYRERYARAQDRDLFWRSFASSRFANLPEFLYAYRDPGKVSFHKLLVSLINNFQMVAGNWRSYQLPISKVGYFLGFYVWGRLLYYFVCTLTGKNIFWAHVKKPEITEKIARDRKIIQAYLGWQGLASL